MIITRLIGGLGNQMFQYAVGRALAAKHRTALKLDATGFEVYKLHDYNLGQFTVIESFATPEELRVFQNAEATSSGPATVRESEALDFCPAVFEAPSDTYLIGYWQSEKYFLPIRKILLDEFSPRAPLTALDERIRDAMARSNSVSLHVRRGDYVSNAQTNAVHGVCDLDYYSRAVMWMTEQVGMTEFFVFSDDAPWCQENLHLPGKATFISHNGRDRNFMDIHLMSCCKHHILANSSFSWWGAWLNPNPEKRIVAPKRWFLTTAYNDSHIVPESWQRL